MNIIKITGKGIPDKYLKMPLLKGKKNIGKNITELKKDNLKKGKERGANGKVRSKKQILAIALSKAGVIKKK